MGKMYKDPVYGYIEVDDKNQRIIDTASFQRLRDIQQTSYTPLYASSLHNRFVHSIGVYYLGSIVSETILKSTSFKSIEKDVPNADKYIEVFKSACLLHDIGHAPFSHTAEDFYIKDQNMDELHRRLAEVCGDSDILQEIKEKGYRAAPHELMSAIIGLKEYPEVVDEEYRSFFVRCITGYLYVSRDTGVQEYSFQNCLISLLNSNLIDVDRLDYLSRDSLMTGFDTVRIDYERLLKSIRLYKNETGEYLLCYYKSALSVIENAVYAHDNEKKWIQTHPTVIYEGYLLQQIVKKIITEEFDSEFIPEETLSLKGVKTKNNRIIRLFSDSDIFFLMKNLEMENSCVKEFFDRKQRKHPLWKSEAEFNAVFGKDADEITSELVKVLDMLRFLGLPQEINEVTLAAAEKDIASIKVSDADDALLIDDSKKMLLAQEKNVEWMKIWKKFADEEKIPFKFLFINHKAFTSAFGKSDLGNTKILFPQITEPCVFEEVSTVLSISKQGKAQAFFFVYYERGTSGQDINIEKLAVSLARFASEERTRKRFK